mmetsp:Transcript_17015/g.50787  ORF Transcript_17015/g.50787 Transcript_17015/m.50787 type:complete len:212 (+) Transcript_17015:596-1231(+)
MGCVSGVAFSSSFHILIDLSASALASRLPERSKARAKMPDSDSRDPGWTGEMPAWNLLPLFQSYPQRDPLSPPVIMTLSSLMARAFTMVRGSCSVLCRNSPWGRRYFLMLSAEPAAKEYSCGCAAMARMLFLWYVSVLMVLPFRRSHILIVLSWLPVMICGSVPWVRMDATVSSCPLRQCTCTLVRMSHTRATESRPPVTSTSRVGCSASE